MRAADVIIDVYAAESACCCARRLPADRCTPTRRACSSTTPRRGSRSPRGRARRDGRRRHAADAAAALRPRAEGRRRSTPSRSAGGSPLRSPSGACILSRVRRLAASPCPRRLRWRGFGLLPAVLRPPLCGAARCRPSRGGRRRRAARIVDRESPESPPQASARRSSRCPTSRSTSSTACRRASRRAATRSIEMPTSTGQAAPDAAHRHAGLHAQGPAADPHRVRRGRRPRCGGCSCRSAT